MNSEIEKTFCKLNLLLAIVCLNLRHFCSNLDQKYIFDLLAKRDLCSALSFLIDAKTLLFANIESLH